MRRYIDITDIEIPSDENDYDELVAFADAIAEQEIIQLPERKKGHWIEFPNHIAYKCSECGRIIQTTDGRRNVSKHYPFCHCGADMREGEER